MKTYQQTLNRRRKLFFRFLFLYILCRGKKLMFICINNENLWQWWWTEVIILYFSYFMPLNIYATCWCYFIIFHFAKTMNNVTWGRLSFDVLYMMTYPPLKSLTKIFFWKILIRINRLLHICKVWGKVVCQNSSSIQISKLRIVKFLSFH